MCDSHKKKSPPQIEFWTPKIEKAIKIGDFRLKKSAIPPLFLLNPRTDAVDDRSEQGSDHAVLRGIAARVVVRDREDDHGLDLRGFARF
jgi:hypothetical protein